jgi:hypothetical protein
MDCKCGSSNEHPPPRKETGKKYRRNEEYTNTGGMKRNEEDRRNEEYTNKGAMGSTQVCCAIEAAAMGTHLYRMDKVMIINYVDHAIQPETQTQQTILVYSSRFCTTFCQQTFSVFSFDFDSW